MGKKNGAHDRARTGEPLPYQGSALPPELRGLINLVWKIPLLFQPLPSRMSAHVVQRRQPVQRHHLLHAIFYSLVERGGFEPPKAEAGRFTVCSLWPLGNLSTIKSNIPYIFLNQNASIFLLELAVGFEPATC